VSLQFTLTMSVLHDQNGGKANFPLFPLFPDRSAVCRRIASSANAGMELHDTSKSEIQIKCCMEDRDDVPEIRILR